MSSAPAKATSKDHKAKVSTVKKWESELKCKLEYDVNGADAICLRCVVCKRWEKRIEKVKGFNTNWIRPGAKSIKKDGLKSHLETNQHKEAVRLENRSNMGAEVEEFLNEIYLLYRTSPKRYRELHVLPKLTVRLYPTKAYGTRWIDHKLWAMKIGLDQYGALITHIESLSQTDSQEKRRAQLKGFLKR